MGRAEGGEWNWRNSREAGGGELPLISDDCDDAIAAACEAEVGEPIIAGEGVG